MYNRFYSTRVDPLTSHCWGASPKLEFWREVDPWGRMLRPGNNTEHNMVPDLNEAQWPRLPQNPQVEGGHKSILTFDQFLNLRFTRIPKHVWALGQSWLPPHMKWGRGRKMRDPVPDRIYETEGGPIQLHQTRDLARNMAKLVQIKHHLFNWKNLPNSLQKKISLITDNLCPPLLNDLLSLEYAEVGKDFGGKLVKVTNAHLTTQAKILEDKLLGSDLVHLPQAYPIARKLLVDHFGKSLPGYIVDLLGEIQTLVGGSRRGDDIMIVTRELPPSTEMEVAPSALVGDASEVSFNRGTLINVPTPINVESNISVPVSVLNVELDIPRDIPNIPVSNRFQVLQADHVEVEQTSNRKRQIGARTPPSSSDGLEQLPTSKRSKRRVRRRRIVFTDVDSSIEKSASPNPNPNPNPENNNKVAIDVFHISLLNNSTHCSSPPDPTTVLPSNTVAKPSSVTVSNCNFVTKLNLSPSPVLALSGRIREVDQVVSKVLNLSPSPVLALSGRIREVDPVISKVLNLSPSPVLALSGRIRGVDPVVSKVLSRNPDLRSVQPCEIDSTSTCRGPNRPLVDNTVVRDGPGDEMVIINLSDDEPPFISGIPLAKDSEGLRVLSTVPVGVVQTTDSPLIDVRTRSVGSSSGAGRMPLKDDDCARVQPGIFLERRDKITPLDIHCDTKILLVGDSNTRDFRPPPMGWQIICIPGLQLTQLAVLLKISVKPPNLKHIILSAGVNDRDSTDTVPLVDCFKACRAPFRMIHFQAILFPKDFLDLRQVNNLIRFNKVAKDCDFVKVIHTLTTQPTFRSTIHFDNDTAKLIFDNIISHITSLNYK